MKKLEGHLDFIASGKLFGWAVDYQALNFPVEVEIYINGVYVALILADIHRNDLFRSGIGTGNYGFEFIIPPAFLDKDELIFEAHVVADKQRLIELIDSGRIFERNSDGKFVKTDKKMYHDKKTIILLTSPTSATGSIWRILTILGESKYHLNSLTDDFYSKNRLDDLKSEPIPETGNLVLFNTPYVFNKSLDLSKYKFILNVRDPRDMLCNHYHWFFQHENPAKSEEELAELKQAVALRGIDVFCMAENMNYYYQNFYEIFENGIKDQIILATYALLCCEFDIFIKLVSEFLEITPTQNQLDRLEAERVENLEKNPRWIGHQWSGSDPMPGRFLKELKPETVSALNQRYQKILDWLATNDHPSVRASYNKCR